MFRKTEQKRDLGLFLETSKQSESSSEDGSVPFLAGLVQKRHGFNEYLPYLLSRSFLRPWRIQASQSLRASRWDVF